MVKESGCWPWVAGPGCLARDRKDGPCCVQAFESVLDAPSAAVVAPVDNLAATTEAEPGRGRVHDDQLVFGDPRMAVQEMSHVDGCRLTHTKNSPTATEQASASANWARAGEAD